MTLIHFEYMPIDQEALESRNKRTIWLLAGAGVSLLLPLLGLFYIRANESRSVHPPSSTIMFDRREPGESKISSYKTVAGVKTTRAAATPVKDSSSLNFVKGSGEYFKDKEAETPASNPEPRVSPPPAEAKASVKGSQKSFTPPKLQGVKTFNTLKKSSSQEDMLKNLPPGAENNPEILKYLKGR